jgi:hypothetical protein
MSGLPEPDLSGPDAGRLLWQKGGDVVAKVLLNY